MIIYEGFFIQNNLTGKLSKDIEFKHVTTEYKPAKTHEHLYGAVARFKVTGYGNDGINEGLSVALSSIDVSELGETRGKASELYELFQSIEVPHITLSISPEGKAVNTRFLDFSPQYKDDSTIIGIFGGFNGNKPILEAI